jgi:hypothetical protein
MYVCITVSLEDGSKQLEELVGPFRQSFWDLFFDGDGLVKRELGIVGPSLCLVTQDIEGILNLQEDGSIFLSIGCLVLRLVGVVHQHCLVVGSFDSFI